MWTIGLDTYDLEPFMHRHPGGAAVLRHTRGTDATVLFGMHHLDYRKARAALARYRVGRADEGAAQEPFAERSFQGVLYDRARAALRARGDARGGPTRACLATFGAACAAYAAGLVATLALDSPAAAVATGLLASVVGAFGHNFVHQPGYRRCAYALDAVGLSSLAWEREHCLEHHPYTNGSRDPYVRGTEPFLVTDPTARRTWLQATVFPAAAPLVLSCGVLGNYVLHARAVLLGRERFGLEKLWLPCLYLAFAGARGATRGALLFALVFGTLGVWYFSLALANHNTAAAQDVAARRGADWATRQVLACADWCTGAPWTVSAALLFLNRHTVHHVFPTVDVGHHACLQAVLEQTCREHGVPYRPHLSLAGALCQTVAGFARARAPHAALER